LKDRNLERAPIRHSDFRRSQGQEGLNRLNLGLSQCPEDGDPADIVNQNEPRTHPLYIHFTFESQGEAMHPLLDAEIGKGRLHDHQPSGIIALSRFTIDLWLHCIDQVPAAAYPLEWKDTCARGAFENSISRTVSCAYHLPGSHFALQRFTFISL
jgi:hypothetical protein